MGELTQARAPTARRIDDAQLLLCGLAWAAGVIHVRAAIEHIAHVPEAVFFEALAIAQLLWGVMLYRAPSRTLQLAGAAGSVAVVALWIVSRTVGVPVGPDAWVPEPVGALDVLASADELALAVLVATRGGSRRVVATVSAVALVLLLFSSLSVIGPGSHH